MRQVSAWVGAGVLTAGVSAAMFAGAGAANADEGGSDPKDTATSATSDAPSKTTASAEHRKRPALGERNSGAAKEPRRAGHLRRGEASVRDSVRGDRDPGADEAVSADQETARTARTDKKRRGVVEPDARAGTEPGIESVAAPSVATKEPATRPGLSDIRREITARLTPRIPDREQPAKTVDTSPGTDAVTTLQAPASIAAEDTAPAAASRKIPVIGEILGPDQPDYPPLVRAVGSAIFNLLGAVVQAVDGPPRVPHELRDSVKVSSSTLVVSPGNEIAADWYFPAEADPAKPPQRIIYLQHGILASGPMYSHTASYLAQRTNSVVVVTTVTSNPFADDGMWLGGDNMHKAVAQLFLDDDREALNASLTTATLKADAPIMTVPKDFVLVGHSLGGGFVPGVAGHYAEGLVTRRDDPANAEDEANHLAGVVMLDAVPFHPIMPRATDRLKILESSGDPADYVPMYEIGAPTNLLNAFSSVNDELTEARPGKFNGVVINGGVHMDGMLGGNPLIQAAAYLVAGIPQPQNPPAVQWLMAGWINDMFEGTVDPTTGRCLGDDCHGIYGDVGSTIRIPTEKGEASAVVIDSGELPADARLTDRFEPRDASSADVPRGWQYWIPLQIAA
ncbi:alpha/beta hydrolase [Mycobacterium manitobense]|uniref:Alpha/beta hydrolase n=1 Tax=[Mycobacterium] manitobense TaxID=190147 RepID=A0A9X3BMG8_9MYCO|nr:alpha/beta hydrolase [[Mycobacterium] manitobense]MCV7170399.1 alpha/beta hydrolase [[Mycobacterium] manitobense]